MHLPTHTQQRRSRGRHKGQNLVELALTLPYVLIMIFFVIEMGRAWMTFEGAKMAARDGAYTASIYHNTQAGKGQMDYKLAAAGLTAKTSQVKQMPGQHAYQAEVTVSYSPFFSGLSIPTISGPIQIFPAAFDVSYSAVTDVSVY